MTASMSVFIEAPVPRVFEFFRDPSHWEEAGSGVTFRDVHVTPEGVGTFYAWSSRVAGVPVEGFNVFIEFVSNQRIVDRSSLSIEGTWTYTFAAEGTGTRVRLWNQAGRLWRLPLLERLVDALAAAGHRPVLTRLKAELEAADTEPHDGRTNSAIGISARR